MRASQQAYLVRNTEDTQEACAPSLNEAAHTG